jgi:hypothetical protein
MAVTEPKTTKEEDSTLKDAVEKHSGKNWAAISELAQGSRTENSVGIGGTMTCTPRATRQPHVLRVNGQKRKTTSCGMQY